MGPFLITLAFITVLVVTGIIVNMYLYGSDAKRLRRSRGLKPVPSRYTTGEVMSDAEYYAHLVRVHEDGPRYARHFVTVIFVMVIVMIFIAIALLSGPILK